MIGPVWGPLIGSVGIFLDPATWYTEALVPTELWLYVRRGERGAARHERALMSYAKWFHAGLKAGPERINHPFPLMTGFFHGAKQFGAMERLWRRLSGGKKVGVLFMWE